MYFYFYVPAMNNWNVKFQKMDPNKMYIQFNAENGNIDEINADINGNTVFMY